MAARKTAPGTKSAAKTKTAPGTKSAAKTKTAPGTKSAAIERVQQNGAWHCPLCDHANHAHNTEACQGCGAVRDGDTVTPVGPIAPVEAPAEDGEADGQG